MKNLCTEDLIKILDLKPHPEGGYFRESYRAKGKVEVNELKGSRNYSTAIYYLLESNDRSKLHRLASDEVWHFYLGDPLVIVEIDETGSVKETVLGADVARGEILQYVVKAKKWFGACVAPGGSYALVGCTVAPGFDFADFEIGDRRQLLKQFPQARLIIEKVT
ncbi:MAG: cupin domain-containing protein [Pseudomonadota bacterium]|nr:cupin domain-containing protein [Patescibacteria group bacterium]